jgi:ribosome maturation factor RimP
VVKTTRVLDPGFFIIGVRIPGVWCGSRATDTADIVLANMNRELISSLWAIIEPVLEPEGVELVEIEFKPEGTRWILRLYIDAPGGVTLDDCESVSRQVGALLDIKDPIQQKYSLEVSSLGINRVIRKEKDFSRFAGSPVRIKTRMKISGRRNFLGTLQGVEDSKIIVIVDGSRIEINPDDLEKARLDLPEKELFRKDLKRRSASGD